jgi:hypothetical protein
MKAKNYEFPQLGHGDLRQFAEGAMAIWTKFAG